MKTTIPSRLRPVLPFLFAAASLVLGALPASAAAYIKFDGVDGESTQQDHKNWCEVSSMSMGTRRAGGTGSTAGRAEFKEFTVTKKTDRSSPKLMEAVCLGKVIPKVELHLTETGPDGEETYLVIELENVLVSSYSLGAGGDSAPVDQMSLNFERIKLTRRGKSGNVEFEWKVEEGES
jgi:type VI secretion system secreted protein Hcp